MSIFVDEEHRLLFQEEREKLANRYQEDAYYLSLLYIMTSDEELYRKMKPYFDGIKGEFHFIEMFEETDLSSGYMIIAKLAVHLFNNGKEVTPLDLISLEQKFMEVAMTAIYIRRTGAV